jgi:Uncharacterized homolog of gamma-carboxymuconolactone decarboxylase subunit
MSIKEKFEAMRKNGIEVPRPLEVLGELDEKAALAHIDNKNATFVPGALSVKYKALLAISAAVALDSTPCIQNNVKLARQNGAIKEEIMEAIAVAKFAKAATVVSAAAPALEWLASQAD